MLAPASVGTRWQRDLQGRILQKTYPGGATETTTRDSAGRIATQTDPLGHTRTLARSLDGQPLGWHYHGGPLSASYDELYPRLTSLANPVSTHTWDYHPAGSPGAGQPARQRIQYHLASGLDTIHTIDTAWDALGRITAPTLDGQYASTWTWDELGAENRLHWCLDVQFNEDPSRVRSGYAANNLAVVRHIVMNLPRLNTTRKASIKSKRMLAASIDEFRAELLGVMT